MTIQRSRFVCSLTDATVLRIRTYQPITGMDGHHGVELATEECSNEVRCSMRGLLDQCPMRAAAR